MKQKFFFLFDKNKKSQYFKKKILKKFSNKSPKSATHFVVAGGDGFMLSSLKKYYKYNKPFYGVNCGTFGFLMNNLDIINFYSKINKAKKISINPLEFKTKSKGKNTKKVIAINEISLFRQSRQTASLALKVGKKIIIKKLISDGILVSSPAGSTAYNLSVNGPILNLNSKKISIAPISAFRPRRWIGKIVSDRSQILITNLNPSKRPVSAVADNIEVRNAKKIVIKVQKKIRFNLLYDRNKSLQKKIKLEQVRKDIY
mgnify:CR=1 FL=1